MVAGERRIIRRLAAAVGAVTDRALRVVDRLAQAQQQAAFGRSGRRGRGSRRAALREALR